MFDFCIETETNGQIDYYVLTATTDLDLTFSGRTTDNPVESGANVSDHYIKSNVTIKFSGVITDVVNLNGTEDYQLTPDENIKALEKLWLSGTPFTVHVDSKLDSYSNCLFSNLNFSKNSGIGESYSASMTMVQVKISKQGYLTTVPEQTEEVANQHSDGKNAGDGNTVGDVLNKLTGGLFTEDGSLINKIVVKAVELTSGSGGE